MDINFEYKDVTASERLEEFTTQKLDKLINKYEMIVNADVYFKQENTSSDETGMICSIRLNIPGSTVFSESSHDNFEKSVAETIRELSRQLEKIKGKLQNY